MKKSRDVRKKREKERERERERERENEGRKLKEQTKDSNTFGGRARKQSNRRGVWCCPIPKPRAGASGRNTV